MSSTCCPAKPAPRLQPCPLPSPLCHLQRLGLKAGGTPAQRAQRLWLLKDTHMDKLDRKHFAKPGKA